MPFKILLQRLLEDIPGALGAIIIDWEGEAVDHVARINDYEIKVLGAHNGVILNLVRETLRRSDGGRLEEMVIRTGDDNKTLIAPLSDEYLLILQLGPQALVSRAAYKTRRCVDELRSEFIFD